MISVLSAARRRLHRHLMKAEDGFTLPELLIVTVISSVIVAVLASAFLTSTDTTVSASERIDLSRDAELVTTYWAGDVASASTFSQGAVPPGGCDTTGLASPTVIAGFTSTPTATVLRSEIYVQTSTKLVRRYCERTNGTITTQNDVELVKNLSSSGSPVAATCPVETTCRAVPARVQLAVSETSIHNSTPYSYTVQGTPRTDPPSGDPVLGNISLWVGGTLDLGGHSTININNDGIAYVKGASNCTNKTAVNSNNFYQTGTSDPDCPANGTATTFSDPLANISVPNRPATTNPPSTASSCVSGKPTYQPGAYTNNVTISGCLATGVYYFDKNVSLTDVSSAAGGVLIYLNGGTLSLDGNVNLAPLRSSADSSVPLNVTMFMRRDLGSTITIQPSNGSTVVVDGTIYAAAGTLSLSNNNSTLKLTGALDVNNLSMSGHGSQAEAVDIS